ncbi:OmpA family protein [Flagellimonas allohymeniacidonis]|uniref:OmpA family protein n=1 Tax=Flagellimonas allohymeniacidonis TaxID=2517819 RepID=A0A4Q8QHM7_9FLAO|nr:OmpA family protein [Allomuricauda hymeniacidonis]TAI48153.1 OmpA family protein [Allomuricauda hymeniacidonis]
MKTSIKLATTLLFVFGFCLSGNAQLLKKLGKRAEKAAERTVERRVERETTKKTDQALDSILGTGEKKKKTPNTQKTPSEDNNPSSTGNDNSSTSGPEGNTGPKTIQVYSKFDYVPGDKQLFFDDFGFDFVGDFPSKWNTNAGGELVTLGDSPQKWLELKSGYNIYYIPDVPQLPEEYTIEFDIAAVGLDRQTSSTAQLQVLLSNDEKFAAGSNFAFAEIPFCQYAAIGVTVENRINGKREIRSTVKADLRDEILDYPHVSIAVNKLRYRLWVNEVKYLDVPRLVAPGAVLNTVKFHSNGFKDGKEKVFISNLKVAEGGLDLRRTLISQGKVSTNGILFESGSANIQPQSMGIIRQISQVLQQETGMNLKIVGHTDSDGGDDTNLALSQKRAEAVKNALTSVYNIDGSRLVSEGKGESEPVGDNTTVEGKAQNRRVEFIRI